MAEEPESNRPKMVVLATVSADGRLAVSPESLLLYGDQRWQSIDQSPEFNLFEWLKLQHQVGATLEGSGSFVPEGAEVVPLPDYEGDSHALYRDYLPPAVLDRPGHRGWFTAVDGRGRIRWVYKDDFPDPAWQGWHLLVWVAHETPAAYLAYLRQAQIPYLVTGHERVDLGQALRKMKEKLGVECIISTAGGKLNGALLRSGLVDEINLDFLPAVIGGFTTPSLFSAPDLAPDEWPTRLELLSAQAQANGRVWLRYRVTRPSETQVD